MANTNPIVDNKETLQYVIDKGRTTPINVYSAAAVSKGFKGEELTDFTELKNGGALVFTDDGIPFSTRISALYDIAVDEVIDAEGLVVAPGLIDTHVHS